MKKEFKRIKNLSKEILKKEHFKKLKKIKNTHERTEGLKYLIASKFKLKQMNLEAKCPSEKRSLILESKLKLLPAKIKILETSYSKRDYETILKIIKEIEDELKKCLDS